MRRSWLYNWVLYIIIPICFDEERFVYLQSFYQTLPESDALLRISLSIHPSISACLSIDVIIYFIILYFMNSIIFLYRHVFFPSAVFPGFIYAYEGNLFSVIPVMYTLRFALENLLLCLYPSLLHMNLTQVHKCNLTEIFQRLGRIWG